VTRRAINQPAVRVVAFMGSPGLYSVKHDCAVRCRLRCVLGIDVFELNRVCGLSLEC